jgi:hypothetical protein
LTLNNIRPKTAQNNIRSKSAQQYPVESAQQYPTTLKQYRAQQ